MGNRIKAHILFYIFIFLSVYFSGFELVFVYFVSLFIHEYSHYLLSKTNKKMSRTIYLYPFGMNVSVNIDNVKNEKKILIFLIGPIVNIFILLIIVSVWWAFPIAYFYTKDLAYANLCLGFFNLIPIYPLDGGSALLEIFKAYNYHLKAVKIMRIFAIIFSFFFIILFIFSCFYTVNFSCLCIAIFLFSTVFSYDEYVENEIKSKLINNVKEYRAYVIKYNTKYDEIEKYFSDNEYVQFFIMDNENKIIKTLSQQQIKKLFKEDN